ncbi:CarD family transcriptional regulator [Siminovitchia terrae]|uniref:CarD family transcriptional regulator n=1 Tax=Siminovitchia terrae TaxID=1914933 RepID=A0A429X6T4_SIMTE|nr:CarD family transcriptional regulator [Siminovitchia terrae]RST58981.1 transcription factor YdeB [Siminovitchia terrae]GIN89074.1 CarD family transcriptional regulator [Siminovitchia terrae]GIN95143.1 CarD family transcriptional regulator [Siminovitchia terrae]
MFQVGDKVFYPMHGAGIVTAIEEKEFRGELEKYCSITIPSSHMNVMLPVKKASKAGLRSVIDRRTAKRMLEDYYDAEHEPQLPWKQRFSSNMEKIKTGEFEAGLEVLSDLQYRNKEKPLNASEKQMLNNAKRLIVSELSLIKNITESQAEGLLQLPG